MRTAHTYKVVGVTLVVICILVLGMGPQASAERATELEMDHVCRNWLDYSVAQQGMWTNGSAPDISEVRDINIDGARLGRCYAIAPRGYIVVPVLKSLPPVLVYSDESNLDIDKQHGMAELIRDVLHHRTSLFADTYGNLDAVPTGQLLFGERHRTNWDRFAAAPSVFAAELSPKTLPTRDAVGPLLTASWHQHAPYNNYCPSDTGGRSVVGCVATSATQMMHYWQWPTEGIGTHTYTWYGAGMPPQQLSAQLWDSYDWANMADWCPYPACSTAEMNDAVAELNYEVAVAYEMEFGSDGSGISTADLPYVLSCWTDKFLYKSGTNHVHRLSYSSDQWFVVIQTEINANRPIHYFIEGHSIVCDGWSNNGAENQYHMNYGWDDNHNTWYVVDELYPEGMSQWWESMFLGIEPDKSVTFTTETRVGWVPLEVSFAGNSELGTVDSWTWDFNDGDSAFIQSPTHSYDQPGMYDVSLEISAGGQSFTRNKTKYIVALADTMIGDHVYADPDSVIEVVITGNNTIPLKEIRIPVIFSGTLDIDYDSFSNVGCRTEYFEDVQQVAFIPSTKKMCFRLTSSISSGAPDLEPGNGPLLILYFHIDGTPSFGQEAAILLDGYSDRLPTFDGEMAFYETATVAGLVEYSSCCRDIRGNVDGDPNDMIDISDLVYLVDYMFTGGPEPPCWKEANVDGSIMGDINEEVDISDLVYLVDYMFNSGPAPPPCP